MRLLLQNSITKETKLIPVGEFSWEILIGGWLFFPYIKYKLWQPLKIYGFMLMITGLLFLVGENYIPIPTGINNVQHICFSLLSICYFLMIFLHSYWAGIGERECLRYHLLNGWKIVNNTQAAKIALISLGVI